MPKSKGGARDVQERFSGRYGAAQNEATVALEREVIGGDFGANSYTTVAQADALLAALDLRRGRRLLEVGAGRGWPGLYLAKRSGCDVVLTDPPVEGLTDARRRARRERIHGRSECVLATGTSLPFHPRTFDAVVHSDML